MTVLTISFGKLLQRDRVVLGRGQLHRVLWLKVRHLVDWTVILSLLEKLLSNAQSRKEDVDLWKE